MKRILWMIFTLGFAATAWGASRTPSWTRHNNVTWNGNGDVNAFFSQLGESSQPIDSVGLTSDPYASWIANSPSLHATSLGPGGTVGSFTGNDPPDTAHWFQYWLEPYEMIDWHITSSSPAVTKYNAYLYRSQDGQPGRLLAQAARAGNPDSIVYQNGSAGSWVFLRLTLARGYGDDQYVLWGMGDAPQTSPYYLSSFALNGAAQNGIEITDGIDATMTPGRRDDWYFWYWPGTINGEPISAIKLDLSYDSTRVDLDLFAVSPHFDTVLARTDGPHYSAGTGWVTTETGWIYRSPEDTTGLWLNVHTTNDYGYSQPYRINYAQALTPSGAEVAYPYYPATGAYYEGYPGGYYLDSGTGGTVYYNTYNVYHNTYQVQAPPPPPPRAIKQPLPPVKVIKAKPLPRAIRAPRDVPSNPVIIPSAPSPVRVELPAQAPQPAPQPARPVIMAPKAQPQQSPAIQPIPAQEVKAQTEKDS